MDIESIWKGSTGKDDTLHKMLQQSGISSFQSKLPLLKLRKNLLIGIIWAALISAAYIILFFFIHAWQVYLSLGVLIVFNTWIMWESWKLYKKIPTSIAPSQSLKKQLIENYNGFQHWWSIQLKVSVIVYPIATAGGFILGGVLGSDRSVEEFLYNPRMLSFLAITIIVFMPLSYYAAKWVYYKAYGKHLKKLKGLIEELSE